ncbi:hypothetical protein OAP56_04720 [Rickettsiaceae bacterium]|nr:hypothetical protein [Rickettsiaceae bacterium]
MEASTDELNVIVELSSKISFIPLLLATTPLLNVIFELLLECIPSSRLSVLVTKEFITTIALSKCNPVFSLLIAVTEPSTPPDALSKYKPSTLFSFDVIDLVKLPTDPLAITIPSLPLLLMLTSPLNDPVELSKYTPCAPHYYLI